MTRKIVFAPGCFDSFDGTQEELDAFVAEIQKMLADDAVLKTSIPLDPEDEQAFIEAMQSRVSKKLQ